MTSAPEVVLSSLIRDHAETADEKGNRVIKHAAKDAHLVSRVDSKGRLLRQELVLGRDVIIWGHGTRVRTGILPDGQTAAPYAVFDREPSRTRLERARLCVQKYSGDDKYLRHLARAIQLSVGLALAGAEVVTHFAGAPQHARRAAALQSHRRRNQAIALAAFVTFLLVFLFITRR